MQLYLEANSSQYAIQSYEKYAIKINDSVHQQSIIISKSVLITDWRPQHLEDLKEEDLQPIFALKPEIILLGSGSQLIFPENKLLSLALTQGIGIEVMDTAAACRTFMILMSENRHAVAGLILS